MAYNSRKKIKKRNIVEGQVHIKSTFNNTIVTITDLEGNVLAWSSAGALGYKGSKKSTPFAAGEAAKVAAEAAKEMGMVKVTVFSTGVGSGRETAIRAVQAAGIEVISITDETPIPHNGCRPSKRRRG